MIATASRIELRVTTGKDSTPSIYSINNDFIAHIVLPVESLKLVKTQVSNKTGPLPSKQYTNAISDLPNVWPNFK